ncbi:MAG: tryptophan--tRNA ligase [Endomicrobiia bacterium]|nr:MAG: tryptophan--tRNA ligase [Endomicrobiia bacterium]
MVKRVFSAMRPTGRLHLGHYFGALESWVKLQDEYECYYMSADLHALTTDYSDISKIDKNTLNMVADWITVGIDPHKTVLFKQSKVPQHSELFLILSMLTPLKRLYRCPTYKEQLKEIKNKDLHNYGFLGYPILMSADILLYKSDIIPVGEDQISHLEFTREIAKKFNSFYGEFFIKPQERLTKTTKFLGLDGRKMSKSYNNSILLGEDNDVIKDKVESMFTDPLKIKKNDVGHPYGCVVFSFNKVLNRDYKNREEECKTGKIGCVLCKKQLIEILSEFMKPLSEKRKDIIADKAYLGDVIATGCQRAIEFAQKTMEEIHKILEI